MAGGADGIRGAYERHGVRGFYERFGAQYRNPHEEAVGELLALAFASWRPDLSAVLDLACGSGEATLALERLGATGVVGVDPFTGPAYRERTGRDARCLTFEQIAQGALDEHRFSLIVCSFALHLLERSRLPGLLIRLASLGPELLVLTPHTRPSIAPTWGWAEGGEIRHARVRARRYVSSSFPSKNPNSVPT